MDWQPIEALEYNPERQTHVILWNGEHVTVGVQEGEYAFGDALWIDRDGDMNPIIPLPTHFMPLPNPPEPLP